MTLTEFRQQNARLLQNSPSPLLDVDVILSSFLHQKRTWLLAHGNDDLSSVLDKNVKEQFSEAIEKRKKGLAVAYITGKREFYGLDFYVDQNVLIPKSDTEILVEKAIALINENKLKKISDVCTGSGCIAIAVAKNVSCDTEFFLSDVSHTALEVAEKNTRRILGGKEVQSDDGSRCQIGNFHFFLSEIMNAIPYDDFDIILANPPYVPRMLVNSLLRDGRGEPILALDGDSCYIDTRDANYGDGMSIIRNLVAQSFEKLKDGGFFLCETGEYNQEATKICCKASGFSKVETINDLEGAPRVTFAVK